MKDNLVEICIHHFTKNFEECKECHADKRNMECKNYRGTQAKITGQYKAVNIYEL